MNIQGWFPLGLTSLISLLSKGLSRVFSSTTVQKHQISSTQPYGPTHICMPTGKTRALTIWTFVSKVMSLILNTLSRFIIALLPRSKHLLILWLQSLFGEFGAQENEIWRCFHFLPFYLPWSDGTRCHDLTLLNVKFQAGFFTLLFHLHQELFNSSLSDIRVISSAYLRLLIFLLTILIPTCD